MTIEGRWFTAKKLTKEDRRNAFLYCKFRDEQFALYDEYAKSNGILMKTFLVLNVLYYAKDGMTQKEICGRTFQSKQTVNLIVKNLLADGCVTLVESDGDKRNKTVRMTDAGRAYAEKPVRHITWAEDTAMSMFTAEEQELLIALSRRFTQNLTKLVRGKEDEG
ncbi:MAG: helix-turn-helix domain-containing protein [Synergistaceae bacterium]|nr:helix-turn-helix domain-containing protein [Synergistaceae bacterium]